ncbi:helix-turn-helix domain-containing protein [Bacillus infantis]|uniref:helix-turn-helix domain-containing protein n=1 Tax=Bacillus infantis TaxID=324767 RepID=UPI003CF4A446
MNPLGNKIKVLRETHNLTQSDLAEQVGISSQYISFIERGERSPSGETIGKLADYFQVSHDEFLKLKEEEMSYPMNTSVQAVSSVLPEHIQNLVDVLTIIEEDSCKSIVESFLDNINERLLNLLKQYEFREIKQEVLKIRSNWINCYAINVVTDDPIVKTKGCIHLGQPIYFAIEHDSRLMKLTLLASNFSQVKSFEEWIDHHHVSYTKEELIPHLTSKQKVIEYLWFSPSMSCFDKFRHLSTMELNLNSIDVYDVQLSWLIQSQMQTDSVQINTNSAS